MENRIPLYNPLSDEFKCTYRDKDNKPVEYKMRPNEITYFDKHLADHMKKHLADAIINERGIRVNAEYDRVEIYKEIEVNE